MASGKRKRGDRTYSHESVNDGSSRPSPHRPGSTALAQQSREQEQRWRGGGRRQSRGGRGGGSAQRQDTTGNPRSPTNIPNGISQPSSNGPVTVTESPTSHTRPLAADSSRATTERDEAPSKMEQPSAPEPYDWEYLTDETMASWKESGRKSTIDVGIQAQLDEDSVAVGAMFQELLKAGLSRRLDPSDAGAVLKELLASAGQADDDRQDGVRFLSTFDARLLFLDCLSVLTEFDMSNQLLPTLVTSTQISPLLMRHYLDAPLLETLGLIRNTFGRMSIRKTTNLLYRQSNYNLLREETEGYSKLITELFTTSNNQPPSSDVVEETFERVRALVGAFDLDVGRVLDVTLDVFASVLVKQYRFFVKFLRASSWWPQNSRFEGIDSIRQGFDSLPQWALPGSNTWQTNGEDRDMISDARTRRDQAFWSDVRERGMAVYFELGNQRVQGQKPNHSFNLRDGQSEAGADPDQAWIEATGCFPPQGNRVAAQLLGFKLRFYSSKVRNTSDVLPVNLIYLAALLIKIGFISLRDLYPHLWPADEGMEALKEQKLKEKIEKEKLNRPGGGAANALMTAGALSDDIGPMGGRLRETDGNRGTPSRKVDDSTDKTSAAPATDENESLPEPTEQKVQLLKSLLCIGAIPESLLILGRFPWIPDAFPEVAEYIHRILHHCLSKLYESLRPLNERSSLREPKKSADVDQSGLPKGQIRLSEAPPRRVLRWALPDKDDTSEPTDFRFYWDDWADNVPVCQTVDDVFSLSGTLLNFSGVKIGKDPGLVLKLARIGKESLNEDASPANVARWVDLSKRIIVPSLSLTKTNPGVVNEVYDLIKAFGTSTRYSIYAEWYSGSISRLPDIKSAFDQARAETKDVLKRISKTNVKLMARALAKVAYASPGVVFSVAIGQIEAYDNLVEVVVECARYFTLLGYDVLTWSLMSSLGGKGRNRVQADGMLTSKWLAALSLFAGRVFKRYSSLMSPTPILQYVTDQLRKSSTTDLIVLKEVTTSMAGIVPDTNFNDAQTLAMAGGDLLRQQTLLQLHDKRHESKNTAKRLMRSLTEPRLAGQILICIAQERQTCVFGLPEPDSHVKVLGNLFDEIHRVLAQYLDLLRSNLSVKDFNLLVPDVVELITEYGIQTSIAFWICRPSIAMAMSETPKIGSGDTSHAEAPKEKAAGLEEDGDIRMEGDNHQETSTPGTLLRETSAQETDGVIEVGSAETPVKQMSKSSEIDIIPSVNTRSASEPWHPVLRPLMERITATLPEETWSRMSVSFYVTFWQLSLYDIQVPTKSYEEELVRLKTKWMQVKDDRSDLSIAGGVKKEKEKKQLTDMQDRLRDELKGHIQAFSQTKARLLQEKNHWFEGFWSRWDVLNDALIQYCIVPRLLISSNDALFCFKMVKLLHSTGTPNFRTMGLIDHFFRESRFANIVFICTSREAENFGRFLNELLKDLSRWHADRAVYEKEAFGAKKDLPGFARKMVKDGVPESLLDYEDFRRILYKWHKSINSALKACLTSGEHMHIRNAIIVLKTIHEHFPAVNWIGRDQIASVTELSKTEKREDLKIAATSLLGNLKKREKHWLLPQAFNLIDNAQNGPNRGRSGSARPITPQPAEGKVAKSLSAAAPEFQPTSQPIVNNSSNTQSQATKPDAEDGEIDDAKSKQPNTQTQPPVGADHTFDSTSARPLATSNESPQVSNARPELSTEAVPSHSHQSAAGNENGTLNEGLNPGKSDALPESFFAPVDHPDGSSRAEANRMGSTTPGSGRPQHALPSRPEPYPKGGTDRRLIERHEERRDTWDQRQHEQARSERPGDHSRDHSYERRPNPPPLHRGHERGSDRPPPSDWDRRNPSWGGEREAPGRVISEEHYNRSSYDHRNGTKPGEWNDRPSRDRLSSAEVPNGARPPSYQRPLSRDGPMPPPRAHVPPHPDRAPYAEGDQGRRPDQGRLERDNWKGRSSRPQSPRAPDERGGAAQHIRAESRRDERSRTDDRAASADHSAVGQPRGEDSRPPTGPRGERPPRQPAPESAPRELDRSRDLFNSNLAPPPRPQDHDYERTDQDYRSASRQQDPNYGRLNSGPEVPSGPRRNVRGGRNAPLPQPHINNRPPEINTSREMPSPSLPERQPPTGPSSSRNHARSGSSQIEHSIPTPGSSASAPQTPAAESVSNDLVGVHPDRLKEIQNTPTSLTFSRPPAPTAESVKQQTHPPPPVASAPSGPRGPHHPPVSPVGPSLNSRIPPTGPASASDRSRGDKRFAGIQNVLQQAGSSTGSDKSDRGASIRGRGGRSGGVNPHSPPSGPPTPVLARPDLALGRMNELPGAPITDDRSFSRGDRPYESGRDAESRRSGRHGSSRSHSHDREPSRRNEDRFSKRDEYRDRRGGGSSGGGDMRQERDLRRSSDGAGGSGDMRQERELRRNGRDDGGRERDRVRTNRDLRDPRLEDEAARSWGGRTEIRPDLNNGRGGGRDERERDFSRRDGRKRGRGGDDIVGDRGGVHGDKRPRRNI
ncbi:MAG: THO complex subunit 2 [Sclerophora amabilis]|nr:MAG: THO complex subunit 2 [Sclerophora amabilis]